MHRLFLRDEREGDATTFRDRFMELFGEDCAGNLELRNRWQGGEDGR